MMQWHNSYKASKSWKFSLGGWPFCSNPSLMVTNEVESVVSGHIFTKSTPVVFSLDAISQTSSSIVKLIVNANSIQKCFKSKVRLQIKLLLQKMRLSFRVKYYKTQG